MRNAEGSKGYKWVTSVCLCILQCPCTLSRSYVSHLVPMAGGSVQEYKDSETMTCSAGSFQSGKDNTEGENWPGFLLKELDWYLSKWNALIKKNLLLLFRGAELHLFFTCREHKLNQDVCCLLQVRQTHPRETHAFLWEPHLTSGVLLTSCVKQGSLHAFSFKLLFEGIATWVFYSFMHFQTWARVLNRVGI